MIAAIAMFATKSWAIVATLIAERFPFAEKTKNDRKGLDQTTSRSRYFQINMFVVIADSCWKVVVFLLWLYKKSLLF